MFSFFFILERILIQLIFHKLLEHHSIFLHPLEFISDASLVSAVHLIFVLQLLRQPVVRPCVPNIEQLPHFFILFHSLVLLELILGDFLLALALLLFLISLLFFEPLEDMVAQVRIVAIIFILRKCVLSLAANDSL